MMKRFNIACTPMVIFLLIGVSILFSGCTTIEMTAVPKPGVSVSPSGEMASVSKEGLAISVSEAETSSKLKRVLTPFNVVLINQTDHEMEFIPKDILLFDQNNRQFFALKKDALIEAAVSGSEYIGHMSWGVSYHHYYPGYGFYGHYYPWWHDPWPVVYTRPYRAILAQALPIRPITLKPHSTVSGNIYFGVSKKFLQSVRLELTRFAQMPTPSDSNPREIMYTFHFNVIRR